MRQGVNSDACGVQVLNRAKEQGILSSEGPRGGTGPAGLGGDCTRDRVLACAALEVHLLHYLPIHTPHAVRAVHNCTDRMVLNGMRIGWQVSDHHLTVLSHSTLAQREVTAAQWLQKCRGLAPEVAANQVKIESTADSVMLMIYMDNRRSRGHSGPPKLS